VNIPRSKHYYKSKKDKHKDFVVLEAIKDIATDFPSYGYRRITAALKRDDMIVNHKKVHRIMRENGILCSIRRSYRHTTNSKHDLVRYPNLVKSLIPWPNQVWHADITYIRLEASFAYLAAIIDGFSRKVIGYAIGKTVSFSYHLSSYGCNKGKRCKRTYPPFRSGISVLQLKVCRNT
jgi:putative transposase